MKTRLFLPFCLLIFLTGIANAQLNLSIIMEPNPSPYISNWRSKPNTVQFVITNPTGLNQNVRFDGYIIGDTRGKVAETKLDAAIPPVIIPPGVTTMNAVDAHLLDEGVVRYVGSTRGEIEKSGRLPEDNFKLCVRLVTYDPPNTSLTPEMCTSFKIVFIQPPVLINPTNTSQIKATPTFQWSIATQGLGVLITYELTLIELDPGQTSPGVAMLTNIPLAQRMTTVPVYVYLPSEPQLVKGRKYAWRVHAFDPQGKYAFANNGNSEIWTFTYNPVVPPSFVPDVVKSDIKLPTPDKSIFSFVPMSDVVKFILKNSTVKGRLYYTFEKSKLFYEHKLGQKYMLLPSPAKNDLNPLPFVSLRLVKKFKVIPFLNLYSTTVRNTKTGKTYNISPKTVASTTTDANGNFDFHFIEGDSTVLVSNASLSSGGGEFVDYVDNGTLYKYYTVEVINSYYCSSAHEIACQPGETVDVSLSSLVRTYNLDVTVKDKERGTEVGSVCNVYLARPSKELIPFTVPFDEGELETPSKFFGFGQMYTPENPENPTRKFSNSLLGYVIGMHGTEDAPIKGHAVFKRLVRNAGGIDLYIISARTPEKKLDGNYNDLYYFDNNKGLWFQKSKIWDKPGDFDPGYDYSGEVVYNFAFTIKTFTAEIKIKPRLPRIFGRVKRSDSKKDIQNCVVRVERNPPAGFNENVYYDVTNNEGKFEVHDIQPSGTSWAYNIRFLKYGFNIYQMSDRAMAKGYQTNLGTIELDPKLTVTRTVVGEDAKPLPQVEGILGDGTKRYTDEKGVFISPAIPGFQPFHLEKKPKYADKDTNVIIQDNYFELFGAILVDKIVMFEAKRRLEVRVLDQSFSPIKGAVVILEDKYNEPSPGKYKYYLPGSSPYKKTTNEQGIVSFSYLSPSSEANVSISVPNSDYVPTKRFFTGITEGGKWTKKIVVMQAGGRVKGVVYIGEKKVVKPKQKQSGKYQLKLPQSSEFVNNQPCINARVWIEGYPDLTTYTNSLGEYDLRGVPQGNRSVRAARWSSSVDSQVVGAEKNVSIVALKEHIVNLYLAKYNGMDITKLLGFPLEIDKLTEFSNGNINIDGAFVNIPANSKFKVKYTDSRYEFINTELTKYGTGTPPPSRPVSGQVRALDTKINLIALNDFPVEQRDGLGILVAPPGSDFTKGRFIGKCNLDIGAFSVNTNELELKDPDGNSQKWYLGIKNSDSKLLPAVQIGALTSEGGSFDSNGDDLRITNASGGESKFKLNTYNATADAKQSYLASSGVHIQTAVHVTVNGCGEGMSSTCDVVLQLGNVLVKKSGLDPIDPTKIAEQDIPLQLWEFHAKNFGLVGVYFKFDGGIKAPLVKNVIKEETKVTIPFTAMQLRPKEIWGGTFSFSQLDMLGIAKMEITNPTEIGSDSQSWFVTTKKPEIKANQGGGKYLEGLDPTGSIVLNTFYLRSDGTKDISASEDEIIVHKVGSFKLNSFQFGYDTKPYMTMQGSLTLINIPDLSPQFTRIYYIPGGKFGMDGVFFAEPYNAGGVKLTIANGMLTPNGFIAEGDWGMYHNQVILESEYKLNMWFRHRKVGSGYSTIAEIINSDHAPPQTQNLFKNTSAPDVKNVYGRTQIEPGLKWSTKFCGWYQTDDLASPDSMYYTVEGTGGNGAIAVANSTMKMKGTSGGLGMMMEGTNEQFPKGPPPTLLYAEEEKSPFSKMDIHVDLKKMALIMSVHVEKEISPGTGFKGDLTSVISFGAKKFWFFLAAGEGKIQSPKCEGKAIFLAGINYEVPDSDKKLIVDYSISGRPLPPEFALMNGFFTQVAVVMPIPGAPNFSVNFGIGKLTVECAMGGEARLGLNFGESTTFFFGVYATAWIKVDCEASLTIIVVGVKLKAHLLVQAGAGGWFTYNSDAGASFEIKGFIIGKLDFSVCLTSFGSETCGDMTLFKLGGDVEGRIGNGEYMNITPTFEFLGLSI